MVSFNIIKDTTVKEFLESFHLGKSKINKLLSTDFFINGVSPKDYHLKKGDLVTFDDQILGRSNIVSYKDKLNIVYEDDYLIVVNKDIKMLTHPDGNRNDTLANIVSFHLSNTKQEKDVKVVHRLDYDTSGLVVFAKDAISQSFLNYQIENKIFKKEYIALVEGIIKDNKGEINFPIGRNRHESNKYIVSKTGQRALTKYIVLKRLNNKTLVKIDLVTGRPHQIRVHFSHIKHPIVGDELYGKKSDRLYLHARKVKFIHPNTKEFIEITSGDLIWNQL